MVPISRGRGDTRRSWAKRGRRLFAQAGVDGHVHVVTRSGREKKKEKKKKKAALLPLPADLPPGIDQKQINFHFQLGIQLNPKW